MQPARQRKLFAEFLKTAVAEYSFASASLSFFVSPAPAHLPLELQGLWSHVTSDDVRRFEQLLGATASDGNFNFLDPQQFEMALTDLIQHSALLPGTLLFQSVDISKWLINGQAVTTQSQINLYYCTKPCISTSLEFETISHFEFIKRVLADLNFCKLNEKHLKPKKQRGKKIVKEIDE